MHKKTMKKVETVIMGLALGAIPPLVGLLIFWWSTFSFLPDRLVLLASGAGLAAGLIVDLFFLKKWTAKIYDQSSWAWVGIYLFYSICVFGFFMGVPVFNLALAIPAGVFMGGKLAHQQAGDEQKARFIRRTCVFTTLVMGAICLSSAAIALIDPYTAENLEGLLQTRFAVTLPMIITLIVVGGSMLIGLQWWLTSRTIQWTYRQLI